ncbi:MULTISPECIES: M13 family metallopeptidase [unclassified Leptotrichia]|uniref:M13 family metallopeptidase n=1 Tax=unclassified Leptotrichia TaxID=2633022 RepID=UPI0003AE5506|nr:MULTISPECIES: M13 family metallopeptidase [unclassified Leptotrichia]ERL26042.1 peptidase family M13 [Leptotrichia sp. oral taxon 225 str. F0581]WLD73393.1 M13 family metallopeptidase [Leptotrichia sp. HMT-225]
MKKLLTVSLFLASINLIYAENENYGYEEFSVKRTSPKEAKPVQPAPKQMGFWDFYEKQQAKLLKDNDKKLFDELSPTIKAKDDFYDYVNEEWTKKTQIPSTKPAWGSFYELNEKNQDFLRNLINELKNKSSLSADEKKVITLYDSYSDMKKRNEDGLNPIKKDLDRIDAIQNIEDLKKYNIEVTKTGGSEFYGWGVGTDLNDSKNNAIYLGSAGIGLSRDYFQKDTKENRAILEEYTKYVSDILKYADEKDALEKAKKIVAFEKQIANTLLTNEERHDVKKYNNPIKVSDLGTLSKNVDLAQYLKELNVKTDKVIISELNYYKNLDNFVNDANIDIIKDYMKYNLISSAAGILTDDMGKRSFEFFGKYLNGQKERETLEKRALNFTNGSLGEIIGKIYVQRNFSPEAKKNTQQMVDYIKKAMKNRIEKLDWMSAATKKKALEKLAKVNVKIGYPDKWKDYSKMTISSNDTLYEQLKKISEWEYGEELKKVGKPVDKKEWHMDPHTINAYYSPTGNEIVFPAGILQFPFYDYSKSEMASNFGAIGTIIGHELTHAFDVSGAEYDGDGNVKNWWTEEDKLKFDAATKKLERQFSTYSVGDGVNVNGKFTLTENIADLGGLNIAYDALQLYLKDHPNSTKAYADTTNKLFFLSFARMWRQKSTPEYLKNLAKTDSHSPNIFRVNGTLINVDAFHKVFETKPGDKMYKAPEDRIKIW